MLNTIEHGTVRDGQLPLIIAHGLYGSARNWGVIAKRLSDSRQVIAVDMRNHGQSDWSDSHSYPDMADDLAEVIESAGGRADVLGHSMGGKAAMVLALNHESSVNRLIVGDIAPKTYTHSQLPFIHAMRAVDLSNVTRRSDAETALAEQGVESALQSFFTQSMDLANRKWRLNLDVLERYMPEIMSFPTLNGQFTGPALFLSGQNSNYVERADRDTIRTLFPRARFASLPDAGHWLHADKPREFEAAVRVFLDA